MAFEFENETRFPMFATGPGDIGGVDNEPPEAEEEEEAPVPEKGTEPVGQ